MNRHHIASLFLVTAVTLAMLSSCKKGEDLPGKRDGNSKDNIIVANKTNQAYSYSSAVVDKWMTMQIRLIKNTTGVGNHAFSRHFVYAGVAAMESLMPGLPGLAIWSNKWNNLTGLPAADRSARYYYPANANAAMAAINRAFFPNASFVDKSAIDSLENALNQEFLATQPQSVVTVSADFGKSVATAVFNWSETDGYKNANSPYVPPVGPGQWIATPPGYANAATPYWGNNRTVIKGSIENAQPDAPISFSADPASAFGQMAIEVYNASQTLTDDQKAMAAFWKDVPGATSPGHWLSIVQQAVIGTNSSLGKAALAYALTGAAINDALIACFKAKYYHNVMRPVSYMNYYTAHTSWLPYLTTPNHPEYPSSHSALSGAAAEAMERIFGNIGYFTDYTYDYLGYQRRSYSSFTAIGQEAGDSRFYAGIHYKPSIEAGLSQGRKVVANIFSGVGSE